MVMHGPLFFEFIEPVMTNRFSSLLTAVPSVAASLPAHRQMSPREIYGVLFERVQLQRVFADGKTFADAVPRRAPEAIMTDFKRENPTTTDDLRAFVIANFDIPSSMPATAQATRSGLQDYIAGLWSKLERQPQAAVAGSSAIALPEPYVVPGGRFREIYYWDSYFTMLGLAHDGRDNLVESMLRNFESLIERYGHIPNGTRSYYLSRSQPPFLALMAGLSKTVNRAEKLRQLTALQTEHAYWMAGEASVSAENPASSSVVRMADGAILNRYWDELDTPRDESYAEDVATAQASTRPAAEIYRDLRAGAASGWDFSSRWLADPQDFATIHTTDIIPVDLNSLLWMLETTIAERCREMAQPERALAFEAFATRRAQAIRRHLWCDEDGSFADYDFRVGTATPVLSAATLYPLFVGLATQAEADAVAGTVCEKMLARGGLRTTTNTSDQQWDMPNGWAPLQWIAVAGLERYGHADLARNIAARWLATVGAAFGEAGKLLEKYDIEDLKPGGGGEYPVQDGFGWTNGVTRALLARYPDLAV